MCKHPPASPRLRARWSAPGAGCRSTATNPTAWPPRPALRPPARARCCAGLPRCTDRRRWTTCTACAWPRPRPAADHLPHGGGGGAAVWLR
jgi:hypothetical protein